MSDSVRQPTTSGESGWVSTGQSQSATFNEAEIAAISGGNINMVKLTFCLRRLPHLSREEFQKYWIETHGPLVRERAAAIGALRYVQLHTGYDDVNTGLQKSRGGPDPYDGVAELWFEDVDAIAAGLSNEAGRQAAAELLEDERRFIDLANSPLWIADEHQIVP
jgi:uncharacterized protein (TIGR02118 family)